MTSEDFPTCKTLLHSYFRCTQGGRLPVLEKQQRGKEELRVSQQSWDPNTFFWFPNKKLQFINLSRCFHYILPWVLPRKLRPPGGNSLVFHLLHFDMSSQSSVLSKFSLVLTKRKRWPFPYVDWIQWLAFLPLPPARDHLWFLCLLPPFPLFTFCVKLSSIQKTTFICGHLVHPSSSFPSIRYLLGNVVSTASSPFPTLPAFH